MKAAHAVVILMIIASRAAAQAPTGGVSGRVLDPSGAPIQGAELSLIGHNIGTIRRLTTTADGRYLADALRPAPYEIVVRASGFKQLRKTVEIEAGTMTRADLVLPIGEISEEVRVAGAPPLLHPDSHEIGGVVTRAQMEALPLNGRNFLELAKLEPGVTAPVHLPDDRTFVAPLGAGLQTIPRIGSTRVTVDGASVVTPGTVGSLLQVSQDAVQEFQISTVNFEASTGATTSGVVNIVTRSGSNGFSGTGVLFYRDNNLAAYPGLQRDPSNPDPFFRQVQGGAHAGGPLRRDRLFAFAGWESSDQDAVRSVQPRTLEFQALGGIFPSPYLGQQLHVRVDAPLSNRHAVFARYTSGWSRAFVNAGPANLPSGWSERGVWAGQGAAGLTSQLGSRLVNDLRVSYFRVSQDTTPADDQNCAGCFGLGSASVSIPDAGIAFGSSGTLHAVGQRYEASDTVSRNAGRHRVRAGVAWEHALSESSQRLNEPASIILWSPRQVQQLNPSVPLPASYETVDDILQLPLQSFQTAVGPGAPPQRDFKPNRVLDLLRLHAADTWQVGSRLTIDAGLSWLVEPNVLNTDLAKPPLLAPILGDERLGAPTKRLSNVAPVLGVAWTVTSDGRTIVRAGAGRYFDPLASTNAVNLLNERHELSPLGTGRLTVSGANIIVNGRPLQFRLPTTFTGADLLQNIPEIRAELEASMNPDNRDYSVRNLDKTKEGTNLYDPDYETPSATHVALGVQRELAAGIVLSADFVWKHFDHTFINGIDYNRFNSAAGPVLRACTAAERSDVSAVCSNGAMYFDTTIGSARYRGLLVRAEKRLSGRAQFLVSYALGSFIGANGTGVATTESPGGRVFGFNNDDWSENYGPLPTDQRHVLNVSGFAQLPWRLQASAVWSAYSAPPFAAYVAGMDFNGDGTRDDLLPGTSVNQFGRSLTTAELEGLVRDYNEQYAGRRTGGGQVAPYVTVPSTYDFNDAFSTVDVRVSRDVPVGRARLTLIGEAFNVFNTANLVQYSGNLANPAVFGQPGARFTQVFGSGGPRAFQFGARLVF